MENIEEKNEDECYRLSYKQLLFWLLSLPDLVSMDFC
jgi:hypothetical protein